MASHDLPSSSMSGLPSASEAGRNADSNISHHRRSLTFFTGFNETVNDSAVRSYRSETVNNSLFFNYAVRPVTAFVQRKIVPANVHPNIINLCRLPILLFAIIINVAFAPTLREVMSESEYLLLASLLFTCTFLENLAARQSKATLKGSESVVEVTNQVINSFSTAVFAVCTGSALQAGPFWTGFILICSEIYMYTKLWEACALHKTVVPFLTGPLEFEFVTIVIVSTGYYLAEVHGKVIWTFKDVFALQISHVAILCVAWIVVPMVLYSFWTVYNKIKNLEIPPDGKANNTLMRLAVYWVVPLGLLMFWFFMWTTVVDRIGFLRTPWATLLALVTSFTVIATRIVVDRITEKPFQLLFFPHFFTFGFTLLAAFTEDYVVENFAAVMMAILSVVVLGIYLERQLTHLCWVTRSTLI